MTKRKRAAKLKRSTANDIYTTIYRRYQKNLGATLGQIHAWRHLSKFTVRKYVKILESQRLVNKLNGKYYYEGRGAAAPPERPLQTLRGPPPQGVQMTVHCKLDYKSHREGHDIHLEARLVVIIDPNNARQKAQAIADLEHWVQDNFGADVAELIEPSDYGFTEGAVQGSVIKYRWGTSGSWMTIRGK